MNLKSSFVLVVAFLLAPMGLFSQDPPQAVTEQAPAFISAVEGIASFQNFEKAELHMVVKPGDELNTEKGMVEVDLGNGNWVRLGPHARVVFTDLQKESAVLSLWQGSLYLQLTDQTVQVRSPQKERSFHGPRLYRIDVEKNKTNVYEDPRVVDKFDSWSREREEETMLLEADPDYRGTARYRGWGGWMGWSWSPWWPWSRLGWVMGWYPIWYDIYPGFWFHYTWPSWYFGWNPYWYWNSWHYGYYPYYFGSWYYGDYGYRSYGRRGLNVVRKDQLQQPRGIIRRSNPVNGSSSSTLSPRGKIYPSRIGPSNRTTSSVLRSRIYARPSGSYAPRITVPRSFSGRSLRSFSMPSISRSISPPSSGRSSGGVRRR